MIKYTLTMGLLDKDSHVQEINTVQAYNTLNRMVVTKLGFGTITEATGVYTHDDGTIVTEPSLKVEVLATDDSINDDKIKSLAAEMKLQFNQESILFEKYDITGLFI